MPWWEKVTKFLKGEAEEARDLGRDLEEKISADLDRREREMKATPEERLDMVVEDAAQVDTAFDEVARRIEERLPPDDSEHKPPSEQ